MRIRFIGPLLAMVALVSACAGQSDATDTRAGSTATTAAAAAGVASSDVEWVEHEAPADCKCADGSAFTYWSRRADPQRVVLFFQGGGACFSAETCSFGSGTYKQTADADQVTGNGEQPPAGIFDFANEENPFRDWSFVFVPYCTGDVHIGDNVHAYTDDLVVNHVGFRNASAGLDYLVSEFPDASDVFVTGSSAGGVPSPLFGGLVSDELPDVEVSVLSDSSGVYPDNPPVNAAIGALWGTFNNVPDWPENEGLAPEDWSIPGLFTQAGLHDPEIRMARYDAAYDNVQKMFSAMAQVDGGDQLAVVLANEAQIEDAGVAVHSYIAPGDQHTILGRPELYTLEVEGVPFIDWLTRYVEGDDVEDVHCVDCISAADE